MSRLNTLIDKRTRLIEILNASIGCTNYLKTPSLPQCHPAMYENSCKGCVMRHDALPILDYTLKEVLRVQTD